MEGRHALSALSSLRDTPFPQFNQEDSRDPEVDGTTRKEPGSLNDCGEQRPPPQWAGVNEK